VHPSISATPSLQLETLYVLDEAGRILQNREPNGSRGPLFAIIRGPSECAWAVRSDVDPQVSAELAVLAATEPPVVDFRDAPVHAARYCDLLSTAVAQAYPHPPVLSPYHGAAFVFPDRAAGSAAITTSLIEDEALLAPHFGGWVEGEIGQGRAPVVAVLRQRTPVSIAFCARRSDVAAEAGVETLGAFRGQGFATSVVADWARRVRNGGLLPLYSASWDNLPSLAVARKLQLELYATDWNVGLQLASGAERQ
jgi:hypothetical protein